MVLVGELCWVGVYEVVCGFWLGCFTRLGLGLICFDAEDDDLSVLLCYGIFVDCVVVVT